MEEELITQIGLMLTQLRYARRALEDIERSTAGYGSFAFTEAFASGKAFGAPPLLNGALKVHVVNIQDLAPGTGFGGFLEGLLGGVGRFFGGLFGGFIGGTIGGVLLPVWLGQLLGIVNRIDSIIDKLGLVKPKDTPADTTSAADALPPPENTFASLTSTLNLLTGLFRAAASGPGGSSAADRSVSVMPVDQRWIGLLSRVQEILTGISNVLKGVIILLPLALSTLAVLIYRLDDIKLAVLRLLQFALRNVFLLRGVVLTTIFDTVAAIARLAAEMLRILSTAIAKILTSLFSIIDSILSAVGSVLRAVTATLQSTIQPLLKWLVDSASAALTIIGKTPVFRVVVHLVQQIPDVLPALFELIHGRKLDEDQMGLLQSASARARDFDTWMQTPVSGSRAPSHDLPDFPQVDDKIKEELRLLNEGAADAAASVRTEVGSMFSTSESAMRALHRQLGDASLDASTTFYDGLRGRMSTLRGNADALAGTLSSAARELAPDRRPLTGFEVIAKAYEEWLAGGGLRTILSSMTDLLTGPQTVGNSFLGALLRLLTVAGMDDAVSLLDAVGRTLRDDPPRATIEIRDVVIELQPPSDVPVPQQVPNPLLQFAGLDPDVLMEHWADKQHELAQRGFAV